MHCRSPNDWTRSYFPVAGRVIPWVGSNKDRRRSLRISGNEESSIGRLVDRARPSTTPDAPVARSSGHHWQRLPPRPLAGSIPTRLSNDYIVFAKLLGGGVFVSDPQALSARGIALPSPSMVAFQVIFFPLVNVTAARWPSGFLSCGWR